MIDLKPLLLKNLQKLNHEDQARVVYIAGIINDLSQKRKGEMLLTALCMKPKEATDLIFECVNDLKEMDNEQS